MIYSPYQSGPATISRGEGGFSFSFSDPVTMRWKAQIKISPGCLPSIQILIVGARSWITNGWNGQVMFQFYIVHTDSLGMTYSLWSLWIYWKIKKPLHFSENFQKALSAKLCNAGNLSLAFLLWAPQSQPPLVPPFPQHSSLKTHSPSFPSDRTEINLETYFSFSQESKPSLYQSNSVLIVRIQLN